MTKTEITTRILINLGIRPTMAGLPLLRDLIVEYADCSDISKKGIIWAYLHEVAEKQYRTYAALYNRLLVAINSAKERRTPYWAQVFGDMDSKLPCAAFISRIADEVNIKYNDENAVIPPITDEYEQIRWRIKESLSAIDDEERLKLAEIVIGALRWNIPDTAESGVMA